MKLQNLVGLSLIFFLGATEMTAADRPYLNAATRTARWIESTAVKTPRGTVWPAVPPDAAAIQADLYSGVSGTALFLLEMNRATGEKKYLDEAVRAADYLLADLAEDKDMGLYSGVSGISFVLEETYRLSGLKRHRDGVLLGLDKIRSGAIRAGKGVEWTNVTDIISGSSGIGLFLLYAARELNDPALAALAGQAADRLVELGRPEGGGLKWAMSPDFARLMPNFSHGTAGAAYFLATLYGRTRKKEYLDAALDGARYLLSVADTANDGCLIFHNEPDGRNLFYLGWCHGPAGTGRLFERLFEVTGDTAWKSWMLRSGRSLLRSGIPEQQKPGFWNNVGLCCGSAGVADFILGLYGKTEDKTYLDFALRLTADLLAKAAPEQGGLKWIQAEHRVRPDFLQAQTGLMQGAAGVGLWLLRLDAYFQGRKDVIVLPDDPFGN
jgi:lantibiotic modifying enzyme